MSEGIQGTPVLVVAVEDERRDYHDVFDAVRKTLGQAGRRITGQHEFHGVYQLTARADTDSQQAREARNLGASDFAEVNLVRLREERVTRDALTRAMGVMVLDRRHRAEERVTRDALTRAMGVMVLDRRHRAWMLLNDPKSLEQAERALTEAGFVIPDEVKAEDSLYRMLRLRRRP